MARKVPGRNVPDDPAPDAPPGPSQATGRRPPREFDPENIVPPPASMPACTANCFHLEEEDDLQKYKAAHAKLFNDLGGMAIVAAQRIGRRGSKAGIENIVGSFIGRKYSNGKAVPGLALVVQVKRKVTNASSIDSNVQVPPFVEYDGLKIPTDVKAVGDIEAFGYQEYEQPTHCGSSIGYEPTGMTGTLGVLCVVDYDLDQQGKLCILSNNHVMAGVNTGHTGDKIVHPGAADPSSQVITLGTLLRFVDVNLSSTQSTGQVNRVDAALAWTSRTRVTASHHEFTIDPTPLVDWYVNQQVKKEGRTTGYTEGRIIGGDGRTIVKYDVPGGGTAFGYFEDQLVIEGNQGLFSDRGDSGSLIADLNTSQPVGLLFAGGYDSEYQRDVTYANPIALVMQALHIDYFVDQ